MNDNFRHQAWRQRAVQSKAAWIAQIKDVRDIGVRALARPESLTMGEIQEIAFGFLMAARSLERMGRQRDEM